MYTDAPSHCPACNDVIEPPKKFLQPGGFTVDMGTKPHADTDEVHYIEPEPERVSVRDAAWEPFFDPALGRMRKSSDGLVFYISGGLHKRGYSICLECGRAEAEYDDGRPVLAGHEPLRFTKKLTDGTCPGNGKSFAIQPNLSLGHEVNTDDAEFQPVALASEGAGWAMVSALREALSRMLGIESREMGMSVVPRRGVSGEKTYSLFLFDKNAGGAGFAPKAVEFFTEILRDAAAILDCPVQGCESGCSACVLTADLHAQQESLDRKGALVVVRELLKRIADPADADKLIPGIQLSRAIADAISRELAAASADIYLFVEQAFDLSNFNQDRLPHYLPKPSNVAA